MGTSIFKWIASCLAIVMALTSAAAGASVKKKVRSETFPYATPMSFTGPGNAHATMCVQNGTGCLAALAYPSERFLSVSIEDESGLPAPFVVSIDGKTQFPVRCGKTDDPIPLKSANKVEVIVEAFGVPDCAGIGTSGEVTLSYSNLP